MTLKEKCRDYQERANFFLDTDKYIIVHVDGRCFSKKIKNSFKKPFDPIFISAMNDTAKYLCENVQGTKIAYVQSDEISLILHKDTPESDIFFGGRLCKMQSIIASLATAKFNQLMALNKLSEFDAMLPQYDAYEELKNSTLYEFDCKAWNVDSANDAIAWLLFRNIDCIRNSKQQTAQTYLPHKQLMGRNTDEQIALLEQSNGVVWKDFDDGSKYGRIVVKETYEFDILSEDAKIRRDAFYYSDSKAAVFDDDITPSDSEVLHVTRTRWKVNKGMDLTVEANRAALIEMCPSLIID